MHAFERFYFNDAQVFKKHGRCGIPHAKRRQACKLVHEIDRDLLEVCLSVGFHKRHGLYLFEALFALSNKSRLKLLKVFLLNREAPCPVVPAKLCEVLRARAQRLNNAEPLDAPDRALKDARRIRAHNH